MYCDIGYMLLIIFCCSQNSLHHDNSLSVAYTSENEQNALEEDEGSSPGDDYDLDFETSQSLGKTSRRLSSELYMPF